MTPPDTHDDEHNPLTTKDGWRQFVDDAPVCPAMLSPRAFKALTEEKRLAYNEPRLDYHSRLVIVATPTVRNVFTTGRRLVLLNRHQISGRRGLIVTGQAGTGKTTAIAQLGRNHELLVRKRLGSAAAGRLPVVYVTVPPRATPKMLAIEFARFLGLPVVRQETQTSITNAVCDLLIKMRVELALVDEIHNLNLATQTGAEASDQLKYLSERIPATFVLAGIDVAASGLFSGVRGQQIAGRYTVTETEPFAYGTTGQRQNWRNLVASLEDALRLHRHKPGSLVKLDGYLHERTDGAIGSLSQLVRGAALEAIINGSEAITRKTLETIEVDQTAEDARQEHRRNRRPRRRRPDVDAA
ncbi:ATP-binding protein (plasmid) [Streptomyces sp. NBC_01216]|uniref:TniB family NTP-binding protein n=1 Tax=Streptomyces sp. NBC_01216 TaxID=2903778 RepID=UPI003FA3BEA5|nr:ATP-binding protein [Streptomyces sp. NBC_01216]